MNIHHDFSLIFIQPLIKSGQEIYFSASFILNDFCRFKVINYTVLNMKKNNRIYPKVRKKLSTNEIFNTPCWKQDGIRDGFRTIIVKPKL